MLELVKIKYDKDTKEETLEKLSLYIEDIMCLYRDRNGCLILTKQGYSYKVPYKLNELKDFLGF